MSAWLYLPEDAAQEARHDKGRIHLISLSRRLGGLGYLPSQYRRIYASIAGQSYCYDVAYGYSSYNDAAADEIGELFGRRVVRCLREMCENAERRGKTISRDRLDLLGQAFDQTPRLFHGHLHSYYFVRDILKTAASLAPRQRCRCGLPLPRGSAMTTQVTYLVSDKPYVKIGRTTDIKKRWGSGTCTDNPREVRVLDYLCGDYEWMLHARCKRYRRRGEWFRDCKTVRRHWDEVKQIAKRDHYDRISRRSEATV